MLKTIQYLYILYIAYFYKIKPIKLEFDFGYPIFQVLLSETRIHVLWDRESRDTKLSPNFIRKNGLTYFSSIENRYRMIR